MNKTSMLQPAWSYSFSPGRRSILAEIYFPRKIAAQGAIYDSLEEGLKLPLVRKYLTENVEDLMRELEVYRHWFNPNRYGRVGEFRNRFEAGKERMYMCEQVFYGWSTYEVDGVFLKSDGKTVDEERTQAIRLMFKFEDQGIHEQLLKKQGHADVYRAILYWMLSEYGHTDDSLSWSEKELSRFLSRHVLWNHERKQFAKRFYPILAQKIDKWIADCGLFIFGYLVRKFWGKIVQLHSEKRSYLEDQIWVTSIFHMNINIMEPLRKS